MSLSRKNSTDLFDDLAAAFETDKKETVVASTTAEPSAAQQVADLLNDLAKSGDINSDATSESHSSSEADSTNEKASENEDQTEESSLSEKSAKRIARSTKKITQQQPNFEGVSDLLLVDEEHLKSLGKQNNLDKLHAIQVKLADLNDYKTERFAADSKQYKKFLGLFNKHGYSKDKKQVAFTALEDLVNGHGPVSKENSAILRNGVLGKTLRKAAGELAVKLNLPEIATVRGLLAYIAKIAPPAVVVKKDEEKSSEHKI